MKSIFLSILVALTANTAFALTSNSSTDSFGNTTTQFSDGSSANSSTDSFGNTTTQFSDGSSAYSSTDSFGNTSTNYSN